jgi:hypothetical protein
MLTKKEQRLRRSRQTRIRIATQGVARLTVNRTNLHIYASVISGDGSKILAAASTAEVEVRKEIGASGKGGNVAAALLALIKLRLTVLVLRTMAALRRWLMRPAKPACSFKKIGIDVWPSFKLNQQTTLQTMV